MSSTLSDSLPAQSRVAVALSGGVDSAVVAALLKEQGCDVVGLTMLLQKTDHADDAVSVARHLGIDHHCLDLTALFEQEVIRPFAESYAHGETPSPCVRCNRFIKFGALMKAAQERGAKALATGHYARRAENPQGRFCLYRGQDLARDQSYFLFALSQEQIDFLRFPLSGFSKQETREKALSYGLPVAHKPDSQDICFVPQGDYTQIVQQWRPDAFAAGEIVDQAGHVLGQHLGIAHFTVGQRKGLNLSHRKGDHNEPLFVLALEAASRRVVVGPRAALGRQEVDLRDMNWLAEPVPEEGRAVTVRLRSTQPPLPARFFSLPEGKGRIVLSHPHEGVAKGQAGVLYEGDRLLGGGWIA